MLAPGTQLGPYRLVAPLGAGGMGEVYRAHDPRLGRDVAIKVLPARSLQSAEAQARFEREARTLSQFTHPHICTLHDIGTEGGATYLVMELLEGQTLAHRLERGALPVGEVLRIGDEIASALDRAHAAGVVHRDLKPANVMLTKTGAKLMDFGLARVGAAPGGGSGLALSAAPTMTQPLTHEGAIVGTFEYMAPEQLEGREADARSDLWALGCVLYEMATGRRAFGGSSGASLIAAILKEEPRSLAELAPLSPPAIEQVVRRCLAKDPGERWQSARDVRHALEMTGVASGVRPASSAAAGRPRRNLGRGSWLVAAVLASAVVVAATWSWSARRPRVADPAAVTYTRLTMQRGTVSSARFAPDGASIVYAAAWEGRPGELFEIRRELPNSRALGLQRADCLGIEADGTILAKLWDSTPTGPGTLAEVPLTGGAPRRLLEGILAADRSPDRRILVLSRLVAGQCRLEVPPGHVIRETAGRCSTVRLSPDARHVAFIEHLAYDTRGSIVVTDLSGSVLASSAEAWNIPSGLAWSPDGRCVWFCASQDLNVTDLRSLPVHGRERVIHRFDGWRQLLDVSRDGRLLMARRSESRGIRVKPGAQEPERELGWYDWPAGNDLSADGRTLLFDEEGVFGGPRYAVCLRGTDGSPPVKLGPGGYARLSPDRKWALTVQMDPPSRLLLLPTGAGDSLALPRLGNGQYERAGWLPDGKRIVFTASEPGHAARTYVQDVAGGAPRPITAEQLEGTRVSPDGRWLAAERGDSCFACPIEKGRARFIATLRPAERVLQWGADGKCLYVADYYTPTSSVHRLDIDTGRRTLVRTLSLEDSVGVLFMPGAVTPDGCGYSFVHVRRTDDLLVVSGLK